MKLQSELQETIIRLEKIKDKIPTYAKELYKSNDFKNFEIRLVNDCKYAIYNSNEICDIYDKYGCDDSHITTLLISAFKSVFNIKNVSDILKL